MRKIQSIVAGPDRGTLYLLDSDGNLQYATLKGHVLSATPLEIREITPKVQAPRGVAPSQGATQAQPKVGGKSHGKE